MNQVRTEEDVLVYYRVQSVEIDPFSKFLPDDTLLDPRTQYFL